MKGVTKEGTTRNHGGVWRLKKAITLGFAALVLSGCAVPVPIQVASWALDGLSYMVSQKSVTDHGISMIAEQDCALWRGLTEGSICHQNDDAVLIVADTGLSPKLPDAFAADGGAAEPFDPTDITEDLRPIEQQASQDVNVAAAGDGEVPSDISEDLLAIDVFANFEIAAITPKADKPRSLVLVEAVPVEAETPVQQLTTEQASDPGLVLLTTAVGQRPEEVKFSALERRKGEPENGIYFVIGSFRNHANALGLADKHQALLPSVLAANLRGRAIYRVVVGPINGGQEKNIHRSIWKAGISDTWAIRVLPGDWSVTATIIEARITKERGELLAGLPF